MYGFRNQNENTDYKINKEAAVGICKRRFIAQFVLVDLSGPLYEMFESFILMENKLYFLITV